MPETEFNEAAFFEGLAEHCDIATVECKGAWKLAPSMFVAKLKERRDPQTFFVFCYDTLKAKYREHRLMNKEAQLLAQHGGRHTLRLNHDIKSTIRMFSFELRGACPIGNIKKARDYAMQFLVLKNGEEIFWFSEPCKIPAPPSD